jgi:hypothetical protein
MRMRKISSTAVRQSLRSQAWLLRGNSSLPGELVLKSGQLSFIAHNTGSAWPWQLRKLERELASPGIAKAIDEGQKTVVFVWPVGEIRAWCPWYYFGGGIKVARENIVLRFSLGMPANMQLRAGPANPVAAVLQIFATLKDIRNMRTQGALWQRALTGSQARNANQANVRSGDGH